MAAIGLCLLCMLFVHCPCGPEYLGMVLFSVRWLVLIMISSTKSRVTACTYDTTLLNTIWPLLQREYPK